LIFGGRLFHADGPATEKLCGPKPAVLVHGTTVGHPDLPSASGVLLGRISDVKRGHNLEAETEAEDKVMNKKYQIMIDSIRLNLYRHNHVQNDTL